MPGTRRKSDGAAASTAEAVPNDSNSALRSRGPTPEIIESRTASASVSSLVMGVESFTVSKFDYWRRVR